MRPTNSHAAIANALDQPAAGDVADPNWRKLYEVAAADLTVEKELRRIAERDLEQLRAYVEKKENV